MKLKVYSQWNRGWLKAQVGDAIVIKPYEYMHIFINLKNFDFLYMNPFFIKSASSDDHINTVRLQKTLSRIGNMNQGLGSFFV